MPGSDGQKKRKKKKGLRRRTSPPVVIVAHRGAERLRGLEVEYLAAAIEEGGGGGGDGLEGQIGRAGTCGDVGDGDSLTPWAEIRRLRAGFLPV